MAKTSFFGSTGATAEVQDTIQASVDAAATSATNSATSETNSAASAASALASKNAAAISAAAALVSENAAAASVASATGTAADAVATAADRVQTGLDRTAASNSATAAASDATQVATDAAQVASDKTQTAADRVATGQDVTSSAASAAAALASKNAAAASETQVSTDAAQVAADKIQTAADRVQTGQDVTASAASASSATSSQNAASTSAAAALVSQNASAASATAAANSATSIGNDATQTAADRVQTGQDRTATTASAAAAASDASQVSTDAAQVASDKTATAADRVATAADRVQTGIDASNLSTAVTNAQTARTGAETALDEFTDLYLGSKNTSGGNPTTDNDGNALQTGALMYDQTNGLMKTYNGSGWVAAFASAGGALVNTNNLSDVSSASASRTNLGLGTAATTSASDYATAAQGTLAASALQSGDNVSALTNNAGYLTSVPAQSFSSLTGKPTTVAGYGITDAFDGAFSSLSGKPTTVAGYGITDAFDGAYGSLTGTPTIPTNNNQLTNGAGYITSVPAQSFSSLTGKPTTISGYGITDVVGQFTAGTGITIAANGTIATTVTDTDTTYSAGSGLTLSGTTFSHTDTSSQASSNNSGRTYIQDITLDTYGHVTGLATATETVTATTSASDLTSGTLPDARFPATLPAISGANLTNLPASGIASVAADSSPQLGGDLQSNGHDIDFADNDKAIFGAGNDLQIYHDGSNSYISDTGTGHLKVTAASLLVQNVSGNNRIFADQSGPVNLYHGTSGSPKLATSSTGVTVTGTLAATAVTGDGSGLTGIAAGATGGGSDQIFYENGQTVTTNYTITNGKNAMSAGPITINTGVAVTVGTGETWTVV